MQGRYNFIKIEKIVIRNFSLYKKNGKSYEVNEDINQGVYCLAGANGLGKTTFLNSINYGLTGIVLEPEKSVFSPGEIVKSNYGYTERYFKGRIQKKDEGKAEVEITFKVKDNYFRLIRNFFERDELRLLEIYTTTSSRRKTLFKTTKESPQQLNLIYQKELATAIGFVSFDYFIFFQLYILTFDENRRMIFWDERAAASALAVAFNSDPRDAEKLLELTRRIERHESNGRNLRWQATQAKNKAKELYDSSKGKKNRDFEKLESEYRSLTENVDKLEKVFRQIQIEYDTLLKNQSLLNSELMTLKIEHSRLFSKYSKPRSKLLENANVQLSLKREECCVCGSHGSYIAKSIERNIYKDKCPLCNTNINEKNTEAQQGLLKQIRANDKMIGLKNNHLDSLISELSGKEDEMEKAEIKYQTAKQKLQDLIDENPDLSFIQTTNSGLNSLIAQYENQYKFADTEAKEEYAKRDKLKPEYNKLLLKFESSYKEAKTVFVPTFKKLAKSFIGLDLDVVPERSKRGLILVLILQDTARTESFQLSESQRFFLDIALRMSLAIFLSNKNNNATLLIDTPEGSLDIAYENRVGNMFAEFVTTYNQNLIMTANINASQLLVSLAEKCGQKKMQFRRMLDWTDLSIVQKEGERLFKSIYTNIQSKLTAKKT